MLGFTYDTGVLIAAERNVAVVWAKHRELMGRGALPTVPAGVLAQAWRGDGRQANLNRFLRPCEIDPLDERQARAVGAALAITGTADVVGASVVVGAALRGEAVVTGAGDELRALAARLGLDVPIVDV